MSNQDDFNFRPDNPTPAGRSSRPWMWLLLIGAIAIFAFAVGMAVSTFSNRVGNDDPNLLPTPILTSTMAGLPTFTPIAGGAVTVTTTANATITAVTVTATQAVATATSAPTIPPAVGCQRAPHPNFAGIYDNVRLGCATSEMALVWSAWEAFERGAMFWRSDNNLAYAFFNDNNWSPVDERWDGQAVPSRGEPPAGLRAPERGFGYAWGIRDDFFQRLGWASDQERGFCALIQNFERGFLLQSSDVEFCQDNLYNHASSAEWNPLLLTVTNDGAWRNLYGVPVPSVPPAGVTPVSPAPGATVAPPAVATPIPTPNAPAANNSRPRPARNGTFTASTQVPQNLDGNFDDWGGSWFPINNVIQGNNNYGGAEDIGGDFQAAWAADGLYLAVRVRDDRYRAGPAGTDMWQGDSLEIHLDRFLAADYDGTLADADDYQLGVSFGPERSELRLYRWLPLEKESQMGGSGYIVAVGEGYDLELFLPWSLFDIASNEVVPGQNFGFNLSISDNDADAPAQETVLSASPSRTTYNNPTEWGTLILGN